MSTPTATLSATVDADVSWSVQLVAADGATAVYSASDTLEANVSTGQGAPVLFSPTAAWSDATTGIITVSIARTQTASLAPGRYELTLYVSPVNTSLRILGLLASLDLVAVEDLTSGTAAVASPVAVTQGNARARLSTLYCNDEDIAKQAPSDYANICPKDQVKAYGKDGAFLDGSYWVLTSASVNFETLGVVANDVIYLTAPKGAFGAAGTGSLFAIDSVSSGTVTLRRPGFYLGEGSPPTTAALSGVEFKVLTFRPQIDNASYAINKRFSIDDALAGHAAALLYDAQELLDYTVATVLQWAYCNADKGKQTDYDNKLKLYTGIMQSSLASLTLHWGAMQAGRAPQSVVNFGRARR